jgi:cell division protein FtsQ
MSLKKRTILKWCVLVLLMVYSCWITVWAHQEAANHKCTGIEVTVEGSQEMDSIISRGVMEELGNYPKRIVGLQLRQIDTRAIEKYLEKLGNFERVSCVLTASGIMKVDIVPLIPVMRVFCGNSSYYINKDGKHINSNAEFFSDVPIVIGKFSKTFQPRDVLPLVRYIESDRELRDLTASIVAENPNNLILVPRIRGHVVNFGDTTRLDEKKMALLLFYRKVMPYKGWNEYDTISVKFRGEVVATRRDKTRLNHAEEYLEDVDPEEGTLPEEHDPTAATPQENKNINEPV